MSGRIHVQCQTDDWKQAFHKGECALLKEGKAYEAETRRQLHNNGWWLENGPLGTCLIAHVLRHASNVYADLEQLLWRCQPEA